MDSVKVLTLIKTFLKIDLAEAYPNDADPLDTFVLLRVIEHLESVESFDVEEVEDLYCSFKELKYIAQMEENRVQIFNDILTPEILFYVDKRQDELNELLNDLTELDQLDELVNELEATDKKKLNI